MKDTLINPNQLRYIEIYVQDYSTSTRPLSVITENTEFVMILEQEGTILFCNTRSLTQYELGSKYLP